MRIVFLPASRADLRWFHRYYTDIFPDGHKRATDQFDLTLETLRTNPNIGKSSEIHQGVRELPIARTPFMVIYRTTTNRLEILRILDTRSDWKR